jgi:hypothetical protein
MNKNFFRAGTAIVAAGAISATALGAYAGGAFTPAKKDAGSSDVHATGFGTETLTANDTSQWHMSGNFDAEIVSDASGDAALRLSNAETSGSFGDQLYSPVLSVPASDAAGAAADRFIAKFTLDPVAYQEGLRVTVSPDNGSGGRNGFLAIEHADGGMNLMIMGLGGDSDGETLADWTSKTVATGLNPAKTHVVKMKVVKKADALDRFKVKVDRGRWVAVPTFEHYYELTGEDNYETSSLLFRVSGDEVPATEGAGFLIDNVYLWTQHS